MPFKLIASLLSRFTRASLTTTPIEAPRPWGEIASEFADTPAERRFILDQRDHLARLPLEALADPSLLQRASQ